MSCFSKATERSGWCGIACAPSSRRGGRRSRTRGCSPTTRRRTNDWKGGGEKKRRGRARPCGKLWGRGGRKRRPPQGGEGAGPRRASRGCTAAKKQPAADGHLDRAVAGLDGMQGHGLANLFGAHDGKRRLATNQDDKEFFSAVASDAVIRTHRR